MKLVLLIVALPALFAVAGLMLVGIHLVVLPLLLLGKLLVPLVLVISSSSIGFLEGAREYRRY